MITAHKIAVGTILKTKEDVKLSLLGIGFRMNDKIERLKTLLMRDDSHAVENESVIDSFSDISTRDKMKKGKWAKISYSQFAMWDKCPCLEVKLWDKAETFKGNILHIVR